MNHYYTSHPDHWSRILRDIREDNQLTRVELANRSGIGESTIENYEQRKILEPSIYKVECLLEAMGFDLDAILVDSVGSILTVKRNKHTE